MLQITLPADELLVDLKLDPENFSNAFETSRLQSQLALAKHTCTLHSAERYGLLDVIYKHSQAGNGNRYLVQLNALWSINLSFNLEHLNHSGNKTFWVWTDLISAPFQNMTRSSSAIPWIELS